MAEIAQGQWRAYASVDVEGCCRGCGGRQGRVSCEDYGAFEVGCTDVGVESGGNGGATAGGVDGDAPAYRGRGGGDFVDEADDRAVGGGIDFGRGVVGDDIT